MKRICPVTIMMMIVLVVLPMTLLRADDKPGQAAPLPAINVAVEFADHAACAYVAHDRAWFARDGLAVHMYDNYVTGMALAAALARGDIQAAYVCLIPAINLYANAGIPIAVVAGTHKHGYGLVVNPDKIAAPQDLEKTGVRIGCVREGGSVNVLMMKLIDNYHLDRKAVLANVSRMSPPKLLLACRMNRLDAAFLPEQWATMAENSGFSMLLTSHDIWPSLQGSVLVVKRELIEKRPDCVHKLVQVTKESTRWLNDERDEAARIVAAHLSEMRDKLLPHMNNGHCFDITPAVITRSMTRMDFTTDIDPQVVDDIIRYMKEIGYIDSVIQADDLLDLHFMNDE